MAKPKTDNTEALRASEERYRNLFENNLAAVFRSEVGGGLVDVNQALVEFLRWHEQERSTVPEWT